MTIQEQIHYAKLHDFYTQKTLLKMIIKDIEKLRYGYISDGLDVAIGVINKYMDSLTESEEV